MNQVRAVASVLSTLVLSSSTLHGSSESINWASSAYKITFPCSICDARSGKGDVRDVGDNFPKMSKLLTADQLIKGTFLRSAKQTSSMTERALCFASINPRPDGGLSHLRHGGGGAKMTPPPLTRKLGKLEGRAIRRSTALSEPVRSHFGHFFAQVNIEVSRGHQRSNFRKK